MSVTGLALPLSTRLTPGLRNDRRSYDIVDAHGRLVTVVASDYFESVTYRCFDAEAVARLWADAANATVEQKAGVPA